MQKIEINGQTPLALLTVDEFRKLLNLNEKAVTTELNEISNGKEYVYGLAGLAKLLHCSRPTAQTLKNSGKITFCQTGRKIIFDAELVLKEIGNRKAVK